MSRKTADRHKCALQAFAFLFKYKQLSKHNQESVYNLARAFHHLNLTHFAVRLYEQVLNWETEENENHLKKEAAYNLSLIYRASGNESLSRKLLQEYIII
jgi:general transcription factor 3C polypeptide 3 (transcription factor C subunit 4)